MNKLQASQTLFARLLLWSNAGIKIIDGDNIDSEMAIKNTPFVRYSTRVIRVRRKPKIKLML
ncbi:hypothetical protein HL854_09905 [Klebsiella variicola]|nr:hypothetical protein HL854_09905 [Klebsiella variicola]